MRKIKEKEKSKGRERRGTVTGRGVPSLAVEKTSVASGYSFQ